MPKLSQVTTVEVETTVEVAPELQKKLRKELHLYKAKSEQRKKIQSDIDELKERLEGILADVGEEKLKFEGFTVGIQGGTRKVLDKKKFVRLGGDIEVLNKAYVDKPVAAHIKVFAPGDKEERDDD